MVGVYTRIKAFSGIGAFSGMGSFSGMEAFLRMGFSSRMGAFLRRGAFFYVEDLFQYRNSCKGLNEGMRISTFKNRRLFKGGDYSKV